MKIKWSRFPRLLYEVVWLLCEWGLMYGAIYQAKNWAENILSFYLYTAAILGTAGVLSAKIAFEKWGLERTKESVTKRVIPAKACHIIDLALCTVLVASGWWVRGSLMLWAVLMQVAFRGIRDEYIKVEEEKIPKPEKPDISWNARFANNDRMIRVSDEKDSEGFMKSATILKKLFGGHK